MKSTSTLHTDHHRVAQPPLRWASWIAVSSAPQAAEDKISIPHQRATNLEHCARHNGEVVVELLVPGESRHIPTWEDACKEITAYAGLRDLIQRREIDVLVFYDRTRLGRMASLIMTIEALCLRAGIALYETTNPPAEISADYQYERSLIGAIGAVGAQQEVEKLKERRRIGMINRIKRGEFAAQPNWGYNYYYDPQGNRTVKIDADAAHVVGMFFDLYLAGQSLGTIVRAFNAQGVATPSGSGKRWTHGSLQALLNAVNVYAGYAEANQHSRRDAPHIRAKGNWEPIISDLVLSDVLAERAARVKNRRLPGTRYRLTGVCWCLVCGRQFTSMTRPRQYVYLRCAKHRPTVGIREDLVVEALEESIRKVSAGEWGIASGGDGRLEAAQRALAAIETRRRQLLQGYELADTAYVNQRMDESRYNAQIKALEARKRALDAEHSKAMGDYAQESLDGAKGERLLDIAENGLRILHDEDATAVNVWLRRRFRVWCLRSEVAYVEILF